jgi:hypothetical protein
MIHTIVYLRVKTLHPVDLTVRSTRMKCLISQIHYCVHHIYVIPSFTHQKVANISKPSENGNAHIYTRANVSEWDTVQSL